MLSEVIGEEPFGFLQNREIYDMLSITQETLHSIKKKNIKVIILKLDFFKAYDRVDWTFVHLVLIQLGMNLITILDRGMYPKHILCSSY